MDAIKILGPKTLVASPERQLEADSDMQIVHRVQAGDVAAFDRLILKYRERVFSIVYHMTSNREDAADLTQESFIKAFQSIQRFGGQSSFFTWLYRIAVNSTLSHLRKGRLRSFFSLERVDSDEPVSKEIIDALTDKTDADRDAFVHELQEKLNDAMQKLSTKHRTVVTLLKSKASVIRKSPMSWIAPWARCVRGSTTRNNCSRRSSSPIRANDES